MLEKLVERGRVPHVGGRGADLLPRASVVEEQVAVEELARCTQEAAPGSYRR